MKRAIFIILAATLCFTISAQDKIIFQNKEIHSTTSVNSLPPYFDEEDIGMTMWDLQTNASMPDRIHAFDDGTIGVTFFFGMNYSSFPDRGTAYNYYDGTNWGPFPSVSLEPSKAGSSCYTSWGETGEMNVAHLYSSLGEGLIFNRREIKGTGEWTEWSFPGPEGFEDVLWPRLTTSGTNNSTIHLLCSTKPVANGGSTYLGQDGALLYSRSTDGGETWDPQNIVLPEIDSSFYSGFEPEQFLIKARENTVAILTGGDWMDLVLLKSNDSGESWIKTIVWEHPFPDSSAFPTDTFYCPDGSYCLELESEGKAHIAFGIDLLMGDMGWWLPVVDGIVYWNEDRPTFSDDVNALNPYGHPDSELEIDYSLVGWTQDLNNNGIWDVLGEFGNYYSGVSSMPQLVIDDSDDPILIYTSITETYHNGMQDYRHLWLRQGYNHGNNWLDFVHLYDGLSSLFEEHVFPSVSSYHDGHIYVVYQADIEPGMAVRGDLDPYSQNTIRVIDIYWPVRIEENDYCLKGFSVSQNSPNPFSQYALININLSGACNLMLTITDLAGKIVYGSNEGLLSSGLHTIRINGSYLNPGIYFYTVYAGENRVTKKMMIR
jgi:hypothetical protein